MPEYKCMLEAFLCGIGKSVASGRRRSSFQNREKIMGTAFVMIFWVLRLCGEIQFVFGVGQEAFDVFLSVCTIFSQFFPTTVLHT